MINYQKIVLVTSQRFLILLNMQIDFRRGSVEHSSYCSQHSKCQNDILTALQEKVVGTYVELKEADTRTYWSNLFNTASGPGWEGLQIQSTSQTSDTWTNDLHCKATMRRVCIDWKDHTITADGQQENDETLTSATCLQEEWWCYHDCPSSSSCSCSSQLAWDQTVKWHQWHPACEYTKKQEIHAGCFWENSESKCMIWVTCLQDEPSSALLLGQPW
jgi:hypothetical protein